MKANSYEAVLSYEGSWVVRAVPTGLLLAEFYTPDGEGMAKSFAALLNASGTSGHGARPDRLPAADYPPPAYPAGVVGPVEARAAHATHPDGCASAATPSPAPPGVRRAPELMSRGLAVLRERGKEYDSAGGERSAGRAAAAWSAATGRHMSAFEGWLFLSFLKAVRLVQAPPGSRESEDSATDGSVYMALAGEEKGYEGETRRQEAAARKYRRDVETDKQEVSKARAGPVTTIEAGSEAGAADKSPARVARPAARPGGFVKFPGRGLDLSHAEAARVLTRLVNHNGILPGALDEALAFVERTVQTKREEGSLQPPAPEKAP